MQELKLAGDMLDVEVRKAKLGALGAAKYVMQMGLTASTRLDEAGAAGTIPASSLAHSRKQVSNLPLSRVLKRPHPTAPPRP